MHGPSISGVSGVLFVIANNGKTPFTYQWYQGSKGDTSRLVRAAVSSIFTTPELFSTTSYWVRVFSECGASVDSETATITVGQIIELVDPACSADAECNGEYLAEAARGVGLTPDKERLIQADVYRAGIVADGVTKLLLRVHSDSPVTLRLASGKGTLMRRDGSSPGFSLLIEP